MKNWKNNILTRDSSVKDALSRLNMIGIPSTVLFIVDESDTLLGSITDGDIRRGILQNTKLEDSVVSIMNVNCKRIVRNGINNHSIRQFRDKGIFTIPVIDNGEKIIDILNINDYEEIIPVDAVIMAGGRGERLMPLTEDTPKPLLEIGGKPIIEYCIDRLIRFGIQHIYISVNYLGQKIIDYFNDGSERGVSIKYIREELPMGTIGSLSLVRSFHHEVVLLMNSDLLTNIALGDLYNEFVNSGADMAVATIPHHVDLPYAILELQDNSVASLREKPRYTYFANAGIYLIKKELLDYLPVGQFYNATDLMEKTISEGKKLVHFPILDYWLDIGRSSDYYKAQEDVKHISW